MKPGLNLALFGLGPWGTNLLRALAEMPNVRLQAVCDTDPSRLAVAVRGVTGAPPELATIHPDAALSVPGLQAAVIATQPEEHVALGLRALDRGLDLFIEKPLSHSHAQAGALVAEAERRAAILMVGHILEYDGNVSALRQLAQEGALGSLMSFASDRHGCAGDDPWWALAPHDLGLAIGFLGRPLSLSANPGPGEGVTATLELERGNAIICVSRYAAPKTRRFTLTGTRGAITFNDMSRDKLTFDPGVSATASGESARLLQGERQQAKQPCRDALRSELEGFMEAVVSRKRPQTDGAYGAEVVRLLEAGVRSLSRKGARCRLDEWAARAIRPCAAELPER